MKRQALTLILALSFLPLFACGSGGQGESSHAKLALGEADAMLADDQATPTLPNASTADPLEAYLGDSSPDRTPCSAMPAFPILEPVEVKDPDSSSFSGLDPSSFFGLDPGILSKLDLSKLTKTIPSPLPSAEPDAALEKEVTDSSQDYSLAACAEPDSGKVLVCHVPSGNPEAAHTICIAESGAELGHGLNLSDPYAVGGHGGDRLGSCESLAAKVSE